MDTPISMFSTVSAALGEMQKVRATDLTTDKIEPKRTHHTVGPCLLLRSPIMCFEAGLGSNITQ